MYNISSPLFWYKVIFTFELLISEALITYTLKKRSHFVLRALFSVLAMGGISFAIPLMSYSAWYSSILFTVIFLASLGFMCFCYDESFFNIFFCGTLAYTAQHIAYVTCYFIVNIFSIGSFAVYGEVMQGEISPLFSVIYVSSYVLVYWFIWVFISYQIRKNKSLKLNNSSLLILAAIILLADIVLNAVLVYSGSDISSKIIQFVFFVYSVLSCSLVIGMQFSMLRNKILQDEIKTIQKLWHKDKELYEIKKDKVELVNIKCHDLKHRIREFRKSQDIDYPQLKEIETEISIYDSFLKTNNEVLDIVLSEEGLYCQKKNIQLICMADGKQLNFIAASDLYSLFDNALHNAIEAVMKVEDAEKRIIKLKVIRKNDIVVIHLENYFNKEKELVFDNGMPRTTKENSDYHGYGMRSMQLVAEKLSGGINVSVDDDIFYLNIFIPAPKNETEMLKTDENKKIL